jgi:3-oxoacyl-[acyl-carrier-protein] synthase II
VNSRAVWVTGCGAVTAAGIGTSALEKALLEEWSCVSVESVGGPPLGRAPDPPPSRAGRKLDRSARFFLSAAAEAWEDAGLSDDSPDPRRTAVVEGSSLGPMQELIEAARRNGAGCCHRVRPSDIVRFMTGAGGAAFAQSHGIGGPVLHVSGGSVSAACAIGEAALWVASGRVDIAVAGGAESPLHADIIGLFGAAGILAPGPGADGAPNGCRPFDAERSGTCLGEGAGVVVLEAADRARARGCAPRAVLAGYGTGCESHSMTAPDPAGAAVASAVGQALGSSDASAIGWIKAHATGTRQGDASECHGLAAALGPALGRIPISGLKPLFGHCLGASGSVEAVAAVLALGLDTVPATLGTRIVDSQLPDCRVVMSAERLVNPGVLLLSESFGGRSAALLLRAA